MQKAVHLFWMCMRVLAGVLIVVLVTMGFFQESLIFHPFVTDSAYEYAFPVPAEEKWFVSGGDRIHSLLLRPPQAKDLILFFHGNAGSLEDWGRVGAEIAQATGLSVWMVDYPGFGKSEGKISSEKQLHDLAQVFFLEARKAFPEASLVIYGRSVGSGLAVPLAAKEEVQGLILESPFWSLEAMAQLVYPWVPTFFLKYKFRSHEHMEKVRAPILVIHGDRDEVIPVAQGEELARLNSAARFVKVPGGRHNDLDAFDHYWGSLKEFTARK